MNGNGYEAYDFELDDLEDVGDYEFDDELAFLVEDEEARRRRRSRRRPVPSGKGQGYYRPRPSANYVTQTQLQAALSKISKDVKANAAGIKTLNSRVGAISDAQKQQTDMLKKEIAQRKKEIAKLKNGVQMAAILPLVTSKTVTIPTDTKIGETEVKAGTKLQVAPDTMSALLPMFLMGDGMGGDGDSSNMLFLALALSGGL